MKLIILIGTFLIFNVLQSIKLYAKANEQAESRQLSKETAIELKNSNNTYAGFNNTSFSNSNNASDNHKTEEKIYLEKLEIPKIIKSDTDNFSSDPIKSLNVNINNFNNINDPRLNKALDIKRISSIQNELLNRLKDNLRLNLLNEEESKKITVTHKEVPIIKRENNDNPDVTWEN